MKVLFHLNQLGYGGTEKAVLTFCQNFDFERVTPYLFLHQETEPIKLFLTKAVTPFSEKARQRYHRKYIRPFVRLDAFKKVLGGKRIFCGGIRAFWRCVNKVQPDIVHFNRGDWSAFYEEAIQDLPSNTACVETNIFGAPPSKAYFDRLTKFYFVSRWLKNKSAWSGNKGQVLYNPIKWPTATDNLRHALHLSQDTFVLGRISRPDMHDDQFIVNVFQKLNQKNIALLVMAASPIIRESAKQYDHIICLEPTTDEVNISQFYNTIDVLLHRRIEGETFGMNIAEAMIHAKPVVSHWSQVDNAQAELLEDKEFGRVGYLAKENDMDEYIEYINQFMRDRALLETTGQNARGKAGQLYSENQITMHLVKEYNALFHK
ncbi:MAG: glycosyltransferase family 4 protein [bacterium]